MRRSTYLFVCALLVSSLCGCAFIKPTTEIVGPGFHIIDTKDNDLLVEKMVYKPETNSFSIDKLILANKSSPVIVANVQQMLAFAEQQRAANEGIRAALGGLSDLARSMMPFLTVTPNTTAAWVAKLAEIQASIDIADQATIRMGQIAAPQPAAISTDENKEER